MKKKTGQRNHGRYKGITREDIKEKALELFLAKGFHATSTTELCRHLGISKPTLYWHFKNKEDLLFYAHQKLMFELLDPIMESMKRIRDPLDRLEYFIREYVSVICKYPVLKLLVHESMSLEQGHSDWIKDHWRKLLKVLRSALKELKEEGRAKNINDTFAALSLFGMCTWPYYWFDYSKPEGAEELMESIHDTFLNGILKQG